MFPIFLDVSYLSGPEAKRWKTPDANKMPPKHIIATSGPKPAGMRLVFVHTVIVAGAGSCITVTMYWGHHILFFAIRRQVRYNAAPNVSDLHAKNQNPYMRCRETRGKALLSSSNAPFQMTRGRKSVHASRMKWPKAKSKTEAPGPAGSCTSLDPKDKRASSSPARATFV